MASSFSVALSLSGQKQEVSSISLKNKGSTKPDRFSRFVRNARTQFKCRARRALPSVVVVTMPNVELQQPLISGGGDEKPEEKAPVVKPLSTPRNKLVEFMILVSI